MSPLVEPVVYLLVKVITGSLTFAIESARLTILLAGIGPKITFAVAEEIFAGTDEIAEIWNDEFVPAFFCTG